MAEIGKILGENRGIFLRKQGKGILSTHLSNVLDTLFSFAVTQSAHDVRATLYGRRCMNVTLQKVREIKQILRLIFEDFKLTMQ